MPALLQMVEESGPTGAARRILPHATDIYTELFTRGRLDLSVEAIVLREEFRTLFSDDELRLAGERLRESNFGTTAVEDDGDREAWAKLARKGRDDWTRENPY